MKKFLNSIKHLETIDVKDFNLDIKKYNIQDVSQYDVNQLVFYTDSSTGGLKKQSASNYTHKLLDKGYAVYCDNKIYFMPTLDNKNCMHFKMDALRKAINRTCKYRAEFNYEFTKHLIEARDFALIKNYIDLYKDKKLVDLDWVRSRLEGKVNNIDKIIEIDFKC